MVKTASTMLPLGTEAPDFSLINVDGTTDTPGAYDSFRPRIAFNGPAVYVAWHDERNGPARDVLYNFSLNFGETWQNAAYRADTDAAGLYDSINPAITVTLDSSAGEAQYVGNIAWQDAREGAYDIQHRRVGGISDDEERRLDGDAAGVGNSLEVEVAGEANTLVVAWEDRRSDRDNAGYNEIYYRYSEDGGATWSAEDLRIDALTPGTSYKNGLQMDVVEGHILAAWIDGRNGTADVYFHRLAVGAQAEFIQVRE